MRAVLGVVKEKGLFFLDSRTTNASVAGAEAAALGVPFLARDVFLDDVAAETSAKGGVPEALETPRGRRALALAAKRGEAIVIGHPRKETLAFSRRRDWLRKESGGEARAGVRARSCRTGRERGEGFLRMWRRARRAPRRRQP